MMGVSVCVRKCIHAFTALGNNGTLSHLHPILPSTLEQFLGTCLDKQCTDIVQLLEIFDERINCIHMGPPFIKLALMPKKGDVSMIICCRLAYNSESELFSGS